MSSDGKYILTMLVAIALALTLMVTLWHDHWPVSGSDVVRDALRLRAR